MSDTLPKPIAAFDADAFIDRFNALWDAHDVDGIVDQFTEDVVFEASFGPDPWGERATGKATAQRLVESIFARVPDLSFEEVRRFVAPGFAVVESMTRGTPVDGAPYKVQIVDLLTLRDSKIAAKRSYRKGRL